MKKARIYGQNKEQVMGIEAFEFSKYYAENSESKGKVGARAFRKTL